MLPHTSTGMPGANAGEGLAHVAAGPVRRARVPRTFLRTESLLERGESTASALTGGYHLAWAIGLGLAIAGILLAVVLLRPESAPQEEEAGLGTVQPAYSEQ